MILEKRKDAQFVVMGHSIGSWISLKLKSKYKELPVISLYHLFPTFRDLAVGINRQMFVSVIIQPYVRNILANLLHYSPKFFNVSISI